MGSLEIGDVVIATEGGRLTFSRDGESVVKIRLDADGLSELMDFLRSVRVDEQNRRRGFRVPILSDRFQSHLRGDLASVPTRARDVSLSGIFLEFPDGTPEIDVSDPVTVFVEYGHDRAELDGIVMRRTDQGVGIVFGHAANVESPTPPAELSRIVMLLEREWLAARIGS